MPDQEAERQLAMKMFGQVMDLTGDDEASSAASLLTLWRMDGKPTPLAIAEPRGK